MIFAAPSIDLARRLLAACEARGFRLATAESCTGGLLAACLTEIPGSSNVIERGYITYDNRAKEEMLGVPFELLAGVGAVSREVALAMAEGARTRADVSLAIAVTGIAGPGGGTATKPVGLVHIAVACVAGGRLHEQHLFPGDRSAVRLASVDAALALALRSLELVKGFGCRPVETERAAPGPASESLQGRNPRWPGAASGSMGI